MLLPFGTGGNEPGKDPSLRRSTPAGDNRPPTRALTGTAFSGATGGEASWVDMVGTFVTTLDAYVCVLLLDDSEASRDIAAIVEKNYVRIDSLTGDSLVLLTTVPPPQAWFALKADFFRKLPPGAGEYHARELSRLSTPEGQTRARYDAQQLAAQHFVEDLAPPALCYVQPAPSLDEPDSVHLDARAFDISGLRTEAGFVQALRYLTDLARRKREVGAGAFDLAGTAHALANPRSLRWRNAASKTGRAVDFVKSWLERVKP